MNRKQPLEDEIAGILYGHRMAEWQQVRPLAQWIAYFDPETKIAYSHTDYLSEDDQRRLLQKHVFESHSQRAYFVVENNKLIEYKGLTLPYSDEIVPASGQPRGLLLKEHGEREARALNDIAKKGACSVKAEYHNVGMALLISDGEIIHYGVLKRWGEDYIPFIRLDLFQIVRQFAIMAEIDHIEVLSNAMMRLGRTLRTAHELGIYHCFTHPGNVDARGNLIDYEHAIYRDEIPAIKENISTKLKSEEIELFSEYGLRFRDVDVFFGGEREILKRCQECFKLTREGLMTKIRFLRDNISLSIGIPVFEILAHLNVGFYEDTLRKLPIRVQRKIIEAFIDNYCSISGREEIKKNVFAVLARAREWTEAISGFIVNPEKPELERQITSEFILNLWNNPLVPFVTTRLRGFSREK